MKIENTLINIQNIRIRGFRRLEEIDLRVRPFFVLIGANGVGKSSLLDVFTLLSASASGKLNSLDLEAWLAEYTIDEVWRMGRIGGRA